MKLGAEPKRLAILGGLVLVGGYTFYSNVLSNPAGAPPEEKPKAALGHLDPDLTPASVPQAKSPVVRGIVRAPAGRMRDSEEFRPSLKVREEDRPDPTTIDPTLRLDLLAKVQAVQLEGGQRDLFRYSTAPPPPLTGKEPIVKVKTPAEIAKQQSSMPPPGPPQPPPPPPILLKYYGYSSARADGRKKAFFLDGEDILVGAEGELVKKRYRVVRIGVNSVVMEDVDNKHEQTLPLVPDPSMG